MTTLHLQDNSIASLHADIFDGLGGLTDLRLSNNAISTLDAGVFTDLDASLLNLHLQDIGGSTDLTTLPAAIFAGLTGLQALDLSCNALTTLDLTATSPFNPFGTSLYYLDIRGNSFSTQPTHADLVAKLTHSFLVLHDTGTTPCKSARETGLSALTVSSGTLDPAFTAPGAALYYVDVADTVDSLTVTATPEDPGATVEIPDPDSTNAFTPTVSLVYGLNVIPFKVRSRDEDGLAYYEIRVNRAYPDSPVAVLRDLTLSDVPLAFNGNTTDYTEIVAFDLATTTVVATPLDPDAATPVIKINDAVDTDGEVSLAQRTDTIKVEVTAEDGTGMETCTITLNDDNTPPTFGTVASGVRLPENSPITSIVAVLTASDVDDDTLTWSLTGVDEDIFTLIKRPDDETRDLRFKVSPNYEAPTDDGMNNVYNVTVNVYDGSVTTERDISITVLNADDDGTVTVTGTLEGGEELTASLTDPDGNPRSITWRWARGDSATGPFTNISGATNAMYTLVAADVTKYMLATASPYTDNHGTGKSASGVSGQVAASNAAPAFSADTTTRSVAETTGSSTPITNVGAVVTATDADNGDTLTYSLSGADSGSFSIVSTSGQIRTRSGQRYNFEVKASYTVVVDVRDSKDAAGDADTAIDDSITVTINLTNVNETPVITTNVIPANFAENGTGTVLDFDATDVDVPTTLTWSVETGDDGGKFDIDSSGFLTFKTPPNFESPTDVGSTAMNNTYVVTVKVSDGSLSDTQTLTVTVTNVNEAPVITSPPTTANFPENETRTVATFTATDQDTSSTQNTLTWTVETADDGGKFSITKNTDGDGELTFSSAPDFETPTDTGDTAMNNTYVVTVKVTDNGTPQGSDTHEIIVRVTNVNEAPTIDAGSAAFNVDENTATATLVQTYEASDVDASTTLTWSLEGEDAGDFTFTKNADGDGELRFRAVPDYEMPADDDDADMVDPDNDYEVTVKVTDNGFPRMNATRDVTVTVTDVNERPVVSGDATPSFMEIEFDVDDDDLHDEDFEIGSYTAYDDDGDGVTWSVSGSDAVRFFINPMTGVLSFSSRPNFEMPADRGSNNEYNIIVNADDGQGETNSVGTFTVTVTVTNVDETPEITGGPAERDFAEIEYDVPRTGVIVDVRVGTYTARDEEGDTIIWTLGGDDAGDFLLDTTEGFLSFKLRPNFEEPVDADMDNVYEIIVQAHDGSSARPDTNTREFPVTVTVTDVNERPDISGDAAFSYVEVPYDNTEPLPALRTYTAEDYDAGDTFTWSLAGPDAAHLEIGGATGVLTFIQGDGPLPDFENPLDETGDGSSNTYNVIVNATDNHRKAASFPVVVTVTNVNERPELTDPVAETVTYDENATIDVATYTARNEEGGVTWTLTGTDSSDFAIDSSSGAVTFNDPPNFESPADSGGDNVYEFTVVATDVMSGGSRLTAEVDVTVTVADLEEAGVITLNTPDLADGETVIFTLSDPDGGIDLDSFQWLREKRTPGGSWGDTTNIETGEITYPYETDEDDVGLELRVRVANYTDRRGSGKTATSEGTNAVTADPIINAAPRFIGSTGRTIEEGVSGNVGDRFTVSDRDGDTLTFGLGTGGNSDLFEINTSTGQLSIAEPLDFETAPNPPLRFYTVTVTLHDGKGVDENNMEINDSSIDVERIVSVIVLDVEEPGVVTLPAGEPEIGVRLQATLEDPDGGVSGAAWQWARSADGQTGWTNISGATSSDYTPGNADASVYLRATVTYEDRRGPGKEASALTGDLVPGENRRPTFPDTENGLRTIAENTRANRDIGAPVAATDPEGDRLTYSLTGPDAGAFDINTRTGQLRTKDALDFETKSSYIVTVNVHDGKDGTGAASTNIDDDRGVMITIENVDEPGTVTLTTDTETISARVPVTAELSDPDNLVTVSWQWHGVV